MYNYRNFEKNTQSCNHYHNHVIEHFYNPKKFLNLHLQQILSLPLQPLITTNLFSVIIVVSVLEFHMNRIKHIQNIVFCVWFPSLGIFLLDSSILLPVSIVCSFLWLTSISLMNISIHSLADRNLDLFPFYDFYEYSNKSIGLNIYFHFSWLNTQSWVVRSMVSVCLNL